MELGEPAGYPLMIDEDIRALARLSEAGDASAVLRYVHALDRIGRTFDALGALSAARSQPEVLAEIRRRAGPLRGAPIGGVWSPGPPIMSAPRLRWTRGLDIQGSWGIEAFIGNPFGLVLVARRLDRRRSWFRCFLDPESGELRGAPKRFDASEVEVAVVEDTAVLHIRRGRRERRLVSHDLLTAQALWEIEDFPGAFESAIRAPRITPQEIAPPSLTGHPLLQQARFNWIGDGGQGSHLEVGDPGTTVWRTPYPTFGSWESPEFIVFHAAEGDIPGSPPTALVIVGVGGETGRLALDRDVSRSDVAIADRTIYTVLSDRRARTTSLTAFDSTGSILWEHALDPEGPTPQMLLAVPSRLLWVTRNFDNPTISCYEQI